MTNQVKEFKYISNKLNKYIWLLHQHKTGKMGALDFERNNIRNYN